MQGKVFRDHLLVGADRAELEDRQIILILGQLLIAGIDLVPEPVVDAGAEVAACAGLALAADGGIPEQRFAEHLCPHRAIILGPHHVAQIGLHPVERAGNLLLRPHS